MNSHFGTEGQQHPLLLTCSDSFMSRASLLEGVKAGAEDVFRLVAWLLDILTQNATTLCQKDIDDYWDRLVIYVRDWEDSKPKDRTIIADTVFRVVRKLLCHHWDVYLSDKLFNMLSETITVKSVNGDVEEQQRFQNRLSEYSDELDEWINNGYDGHLSEEVEAVVKGLKAVVKTINARRGRKSIDPKDITASFSYLPRVDNRVERLQVFFDYLNNVFIDCDKKVFVDIFQGKTTKDKILWIREIRELHYLIDHLEKWIEWPRSYDKWQMTCARFQIREKTKKVVDDNMTNDSYEIKDLKQTQFSKGGKVPETHDELDKIIKILDPKTDYGSALDDYLNYMEAQGEHDDIKDTADALANGLNTDIQI